MKLVDTKPLRSYLKAADEVQVEIAAVYPDWIAILDELDAIWRTELFGETVSTLPAAGQLCLQSFYFWLAAVRIALSGHASAVYPVLRTSLESACYAHLITKDASLSTIWLGRDRDRTSRKRFRAAFGQAVSIVAQQFAGDDTLGTLITQMYEASIDFGGHPNPRAVLDHLQIGNPSETGSYEITFTALNAARSINTVRSLVAVAEHAFVTIALSANVFGEHPRVATLQQRLDAVIGCVELLAAPFMRSESD